MNFQVTGKCLTFTRASGFSPKNVSKKMKRSIRDLCQDSRLCKGWNFRGCERVTSIFHIISMHTLGPAQKV
jgi:hypothetical protein